MGNNIQRGVRKKRKSILWPSINVCSLAVVCEAGSVRSSICLFIISLVLWRWELGRANTRSWLPLVYLLEMRLGLISLARLVKLFSRQAAVHWSCADPGSQPRSSPDQAGQSSMHAKVTQVSLDWITHGLHAEYR